jgi:hypothetical protein
VPEITGNIGFPLSVVGFESVCPSYFSSYYFGLAELHPPLKPIDHSVFNDAGFFLWKTTVEPQRKPEKQ